VLRSESSAFSSENLPNWRAGELVNVPGSRVQASRVVRRRHSTSGSVSGMDGACGAGPTRRAARRSHKCRQQWEEIGGRTTSRRLTLMPGTDRSPSG